MRILITGSSGALAAPLGVWLQAAGHDVTGVSRDPARARAANDIPVVTWRHLTARYLSAQRIDAIVNLAGAPMMQRWNARNKTAILQSRLEVARTISELLWQMPAQLRPECVVHASSVAIYSSCALPVDEFSPPCADTHFFQAQVWQAVEQLIAQLSVPGVRTVVTRFGLAIGADALMHKMLQLSRCYLGSILGNGRQRISWIARHDLQRAILHLLTSPALHGVFNLVAPRPITAAQLGAGIARSVNRPVVIHVPEALLRLLLGELADNFLTSADAMPARLQMAGFSWELPEFERALQAAVEALNTAPANARASRASEPASANRAANTKITGLGETPASNTSVSTPG